MEKMKTGLNLIKNKHERPTPRISNGGLLVVLGFVLRIIASVPGQVIALNSATAHTRKRWQQFGTLKSHTLQS
jgi:hypothetical protein